METIEDYADRVEHEARAAVRFGVHELRMKGTPMSMRAADILESLPINFDAMLEDSLRENGLTTRTDPSDGLRYVVAEGVAA